MTSTSYASQERFHSYPAKLTSSSQEEQYYMIKFYGHNTLKITAEKMSREEGEGETTAAQDDSDIFEAEFDDAAIQAQTGLSSWEEVGKIVFGYGFEPTVEQKEEKLVLDISAPIQKKFFKLTLNKK